MENVSGLLINMPSMKDGPGDLFVIGDIDMECSAAHKDLSVIDIDDINSVIESKDILSTWEDYKKRASKRIYDCKVETLYIQSIKNRNTEASFIKFVSEYGFPVLKSSKAIIDHMGKKLEQFKLLIDKYRTTISTAYKYLGISVEEYKKLVKDIDSNRLQSISQTMFSKLLKNKDLWLRDWGADFTKVGGGLCFANFDDNIMDYLVIAERCYNLSLAYDIVVLTHGTDIKPGHTLTKEEIELAKKIDKIIHDSDGKMSPREAAKKIEDSLTPEERKILNRYGVNRLVSRFNILYKNYNMVYSSELGIFKYYKDLIFGNIKKQWGFWEPLTTPYGTFKDVNQFIRESAAQGYKKIKIMSCNPGHYNLANDIKLMNDVIVDYQKYSVLVESEENIMTNQELYAQLINEAIRLDPDNAYEYLNTLNEGQATIKSKEVIRDLKLSKNDSKFIDFCSGKMSNSEARDFYSAYCGYIDELNERIKEIPPQNFGEDVVAWFLHPFESVKHYFSEVGITALCLLPGELLLGIGVGAKSSGTVLLGNLLTNAGSWYAVIKSFIWSSKTKGGEINWRKAKAERAVANMQKKLNKIYEKNYGRY